MKIKMLRSLAKRPDRLEGQECEVPDEEGKQLVAAQLAVEVVEPPKPAPAKPPKPAT